MEQWRLHEALQLLDSARNDGRRHAELPRRRRKATGFGDPDKRLNAKQSIH
jgi:hypothetical protein